MFEVLFDIACLEKGLPPLSKSDNEVALMVMSMPSDKKRKVTRKLRKVAKLEIKRRCKLVRTNHRRESVKRSLEKRCDIGSTLKGPTRLRTLVQRIRLARTFVSANRLGEEL